MTRALITGIAGFTGRHLASLLVSHGLEVFGITRSQPRGDLATLEGVRLARADLLDRVGVATLVNEIQPTYIFHLASDRGTDDMTELMRRNLGPTYHILEAALRLRSATNVKVLVVGSAAEYGAPRLPILPFNEHDPVRPQSPYGVLKAAEVNLARAYFSDHGLATYVARPFNIVGPGEPTSLVCSAMASQVAATELGRQDPVIGVGNLKAQRDFVDVRDVVRAYWAIVVQAEPGEIYNVCSGKGTPVEAALLTLARLARVPLAHRVEPGRTARRSVMRCVGDPTRIARETGWSPQIPFEKSLTDLLDDWRQRYLDQSNGSVAHHRPNAQNAMEVAFT
jgi:GDP-4-dehydro-6-deoxy-D-mannose reductase